MVRPSVFTTDDAPRRTESPCAIARQRWLQSVDIGHWLLVLATVLLALCSLLAGLEAQAQWQHVSARAAARKTPTIEPLALPDIPAIEPAGSTRPTRLQSAGQVGGNRIELPQSGNRAQAAELVRLQTVAARDGARGTAAGRAAARASWVLGLLYLHGIAVEANPANALAWFQKARALGEPMASAGLAWCAIDGCGLQADPAAARPWLAQLRQVDAARAAYLEWVVEDRLAPLRLPAPGGALPEAPRTPNRNLLVRAANGGNVHARLELGLEAASRNRPAEAASQFRLAAPRSHAAAANLLRVQLQINGGEAPAKGVVIPPSNARQVRPGGAPPTFPPAEGAPDNSVRIDGAGDTAGQSLANARRYHRGDGA